jgi:hypothetical protein
VAAPQAKPRSAARGIPRLRAIASAATALARPRTAITGAPTSVRTPSRTDSADCGSFSAPKGKPAPPSAQYRPSTPYTSDQMPAAYPIHPGHLLHRRNATLAVPAAVSGSSFDGCCRAIVSPFLSAVFRYPQGSRSSGRSARIGVIFDQFTPLSSLVPELLSLCKPGCAIRSPASARGGVPPGSLPSRDPAACALPHAAAA